MIPSNRLSRFMPLTTVFLVLFFVSAGFASTIEGFVFDQGRNGLVDVDVELLNENRQLRQRTRTNGIGRYQFSGLVDGRYYVRVLPFRYNFQDDIKEVEIQSLSLVGGTGAETIQQDFNLAPKKGGLADTTTGVVFAQNVPEAAEQLFKDAKNAIGNENKDEAFRLLIKSVESFPEYFDALTMLGKHLLVRKRFLEAASMFIRAVEVNPKSSNAFYYMGLSFSNLGKDYYKASLIAYEKAMILAPAAYQIPFEMGKVQIELKDFVAAEASLLKAKKLADPKVAEIHLRLAKIYSEELDQFDKAADELETFIKVSKSKDASLKATVEEFRVKASKQT